MFEKQPENERSIGLIKPANKTWSPERALLDSIKNVRKLAGKRGDSCKVAARWSKNKHHECIEFHISLFYRLCDGMPVHPRTIKSQFCGKQNHRWQFTDFFLNPWQIIILRVEGQEKIPAALLFGCWQTARNRALKTLISGLSFRPTTPITTNYAG